MSRSDFFHFLFSSTLDKERGDTAQLYKQMRHVYEQAELSLDLVERDAHYVSEKLCSQLNCDYDSFIATHLNSTLVELMYQSDLYDLPEDIGPDMHFDVEQDSLGRQIMQRKISLLSHSNLNRERVIKTANDVAQKFICTLPVNVFNHAKELDRAYSVPILEFLEKPENLIQSLFESFFTKELNDTALFFDIKQTLQKNLNWVSNNIKKDALPNDLSNKYNAGEIAQLFLNGTLLHELFSLSIPFTIPQSIRFEHTHLVAGSGHGKTQTLQHMIWSDIQSAIENESGFAVIDSQGDLINNIMRCGALKNVSDKLLIIDPNDIEYPPALNMFDAGLERLDHLSLVDREKIINGTIDLYEYIFSSLLGAELTQKQGVIFKYLARIMLILPEATIHTLRELVEGQKKFDSYFEQLDESSQHFFNTQFYSKNFAGTRQQVLTRLWGVLSNSIFERMFSAPRNMINMFEAMNDGKIILINTAKDLLKKEGCSIFGRFFIAMFSQAALSRIVIAKEKRKPFFVYIDEAHDYFDEQIEDITNQARKYNVGLILSHQNLDQLNSHLRATIMSSTSTKLVGGVSAKDALTFSQNMHCKADDLLAIKKSAKSTSLACYLRNITPRPITIEIPFGTLESKDRLSDTDFDTLLVENRARVSLTGVVDEIENSNQQNSIKSEEHQKKERINPSAKQPIQSEKHPQQGKGGERHKEIQHKLQKAAHGKGFGAIIEKHIGDSQHVDLAINSGDKKIACEISVSTSVEHEISNIQKCIKQFHEIWVISDSTSHLVNIQNALSDPARSNVHFYTTEKALEAISKIVIEEPSFIIRGFGTKITWNTPNGDEKIRRETVFSKIVQR